MWKDGEREQKEIRSRSHLQDDLGPDKLIVGSCIYSVAKRVFKYNKDSLQPGRGTPLVSPDHVANPSGFTIQHVSRTTKANPCAAMELQMATNSNGPAKPFQARELKLTRRLNLMMADPRGKHDVPSSHEHPLSVSSDTCGTRAGLPRAHVKPLEPTSLARR